MPNKTQEARSRRSQARERRRSSPAEPVEELEQAAGSPGSDAAPETNGNVGGAAAKMVGTAVAAALLGALGGAVKGMLERRASPPGDREPDTKREAEPDEDAANRPSDEAEPKSGHDDIDFDVEPEQQPQRRAPEKHERPASDDRGLSEGDAETVVSTARRHLEALLGTDVERASGLERADGGWSVYLEVVEVARIPESTDVLATYEVVLGDDGDLAGVSRVRRYRRSQVEEEA
jgi:Gas vesicle synthesis protein GvpO